MICVILGAGGLAREVYWHIQDSNIKNISKFIFVDEITSNEYLLLNNIEFPIEKNWEFNKYRSFSEEPICFTVGIGDTRLRRNMVAKSLTAGLSPLPTIIHNSAIIQDPSCIIGYGGFIGPKCVLTTNIVIKNYVTLNLNTTVGHDTVLEDYVNCSPSVSVSGNVHLKQGVSLGTGTVVREKISVASHVVSGAQSCIVRNILEEDVVVAGVPSQILKHKK